MRHSIYLIALLLIAATSSAQSDQMRLHCVSARSTDEFSVRTIGTDIEDNLIYPELTLPVPMTVRVAITDTLGDTLCATSMEYVQGVYRVVWDSLGQANEQPGSTNVYFFELVATRGERRVAFQYSTKMVFRVKSTDAMLR